MNEGLVVYTVIINRYDSLKPPLVVDPDVRYVCITDEPLSDVPPWRQRVVKGNHGSPRRHARLYKIMAHACFALAEYSLYIDARIQLKIYPADALFWLKEHDLALCQHPTDHCIYDEAKKVWDWHLDDREVVERQMARYKAKGYPKDRGLATTSVILRRHTEAIQRLNNYWWIEVGNHSVRDQLSFDYVCWLLGMRYDVIPGNVFSNPCFAYVPHDGETAWRREETAMQNVR